MNITILALGKTKETFIQDGVAEYLKRLQPLAKVDLKILPETKISPSKTVVAVISQDTDKVITWLDKHVNDSQIIIMDVIGDKLNSEQLSELLIQNRDQGVGKIVFVIGGALGLDYRKIKQALPKVTPMSLSALTFTHDMVRLILLEQIYRGLQIAKGSEYHK